MGTVFYVILFVVGFYFLWLFVMLCANILFMVTGSKLLLERIPNASECSSWEKLFYYSMLLALMPEELVFSFILSVYDRDGHIIERVKNSGKEKGVK